MKKSKEQHSAILLTIRSRYRTLFAHAYLAATNYILFIGWKIRCQALPRIYVPGTLGSVCQGGVHDSLQWMQPTL